MRTEYLYHYSTHKFEYLKTRKLQGFPPKYSDLELKEYCKIGDYNEHVSFFFERLHLSMLSRLFKDIEGSFWNKTDDIYEYKVRISDLPADIKYEIVETSTDISERQKVSKLKWFTNPETDINDTEFKKYKCRLHKIKISKGEVGFSRNEFEKVYHKYTTGVMEHFERAVKYLNSEEDNLLYAANVPHVMIYTNHQIKPISVNLYKRYNNKMLSEW